MTSFFTYPINMVAICIIALSLFIGVVYKVLIPKLIEEFARTLVAKTQSYQEEKGRNQATKEDISEITKMIEDVKASIETTKEIRHEYIENRTNHLFVLLQKLKEFYVINGSVGIALCIRCESGSIVEVGERIMTLYYEIEHEYDIVSILCKGQRANELERVISAMRLLFDEYMHLITHSATAYKNIEQYNETRGSSHESIDSCVKELEELQRNPTPMHYDSFGLALGVYVDYMMTYYKEETFLKYDA